jgi:hypothetical protein
MLNTVKIDHLWNRDSGENLPQIAAQIRFTVILEEPRLVPSDYRNFPASTEP